METAVDLIDLNRGLRIPVQSLTIPPDILIWWRTKPQAGQLAETVQRSKQDSSHMTHLTVFKSGKATGMLNIIAIAVKFQVIT